MRVAQKQYVGKPKFEKERIERSCNQCSKLFVAPSKFVRNCGCNRQFCEWDRY